MRRIALLVSLLGSAALVHADQHAAIPPAATPVVLDAPAAPVLPDKPVVQAPPVCNARGLFESDRMFPNFIGPISNPVLTKDPRSLTEARLVFIQNWFPNAHPLMQGGDMQVYAAPQVRIALTDRLTIMADKAGIAAINANGIPHRSGMLNIAAGAKYAFIRDVENQFLVTGGFLFEPPTGEAKVFQNHGSGVATVFGTVGKEFAECYHVLLNGGYQFGLNSRDNSSFLYAQLHLDRQLFGWLYPLVEVNWFGYTAGGDRGLPAIGEGDGLINLGAPDMAGNHLVTIAAGLKAQFGKHLNVGVVYETPMSSRRDLIDSRILAEVIFRY
jgi:hypothetical protein